MMCAVVMILVMVVWCVVSRNHPPRDVAQLCVTIVLIAVAMVAVDVVRENK